MTGRTCPQCGALVEDQTNVGAGGADPDDGDRSICLYCSGVNVFVTSPFGLGLVLRRATDTELDEFLSDPEYRRVLDALGALRRAGGVPAPESRQP